MNTKRLNLMVTMLQEVLDGTWKVAPSVVKKLKQIDDLILEKVDFNLNSWLEIDTEDTKKVNGCGFAACAVGHAMIDSRFIKIGLREHYDNGYPEFSMYEGWEAVEVFFNIGESTSEYIFSPSTYPAHLSEQKNWRHQIVQVIRRIQLLISLNSEIDFQNALKKYGRPEKSLLDTSLKPYQYRSRAKS